MSWLIWILFGIALILSNYATEQSYKKRLVKEKKESYMKGWDDAAESLKNFDINAYLDTKYEKSDKK